MSPTHSNANADADSVHARGGDARVAACRAGGPQAQAELAEFVEAAAWGALRGDWRGRRLDAAQREDAVQETLTRILDKVLSTEKPVEDLQDWVRGTLRRVLMEGWRRTRANPVRGGLTGGGGGAAPEDGTTLESDSLTDDSAGLDPVDASMAVEERAALWSCVDGLSRPVREMLLLRYREGLRNREIGVRLGKTEKAVELAIPRALKKLRECMLRKGSTQ